MVERDIAASKMEMMFNRELWIRRYHMRIVMLTIYEWQISKVFNKEFYDCLCRIGVHNELVTEFKQASRSFTKAKATVDKDFEWFRNNTIGHRNGDALTVYKKIMRINEGHITGLIGDVFEAAEPLFKLLTEIISISGSTRVIIRQIAAHGDAK
jgi:hypothetical protein